MLKKMKIQRLTNDPLPYIDKYFYLTKYIISCVVRSFMWIISTVHKYVLNGDLLKCSVVG